MISNDDEEGKTLVRARDGNRLLWQVAGIVKYFAGFIYLFFLFSPESINKMTSGNKLTCFMENVSTSSATKYYSYIVT